MQTQILLELHGNKNHRNLQEFWRRFSCFQHRLSDRVIRVQASPKRRVCERRIAESPHTFSGRRSELCCGPQLWVAMLVKKLSLDLDIVILNVRTRSSGKQKSFFWKRLTPQWSRELLIRPFSSTMPFEYIIFLFRCSLLKFLALNVSFKHVWMPSYYASPRQKWQAHGKPAFLEKVVSHERRKRWIKRIGKLKTIKK